MAKTVKLAARQCFHFGLFVLVVAMLWENMLLVLLSAFATRCRCSDVQVPTSDGCYTSSHAPYRLYSTHSDYDDVRGHGVDFSLPGCKPSKFYLLSRHGIRYPTITSFAALSFVLPTVQNMIKESLSNGTLCQKEQEILKNWTFRLNIARAEMLSDSGRKEAYDLGVRFRHRFPGLVGLPYSPERYQFQHTYKPRTRDTAKAIGSAMFGKSDFNMSVNPQNEDPLLRFYSSCDKYQKMVDDQPNIETDAFEKGHEILGVIEHVRQRLGLGPNRLQFAHVYALYEGCTFEHAILGNSPLCVVFSTEDLKVLEYWRDLNYYWHSGYGHTINYEQTCDLVKDLLNYLSDNTTSVTGMIRVAHDSTMLPFYAKLGVFRDHTPLRAANMAAQVNRKWRSSLIAAFGSNIAFVEYQCGSQSKVRVFQNEKPLALPMCPESGCLKSNILDSRLGSFAQKCDFDRTCKYSPVNLCEGHVTHTGACIPTIIG